MNNERFTVPEILFRPTDIGKYHLHPIAMSEPSLTVI